MATNLPKVAPTITKGLKARVKADQEKKLVVMACENAIMGTDILKKASGNRYHDRRRNGSSCSISKHSS